MAMRALEALRLFVCLAIIVGLSGVIAAQVLDALDEPSAPTSTQARTTGTSPKAAPEAEPCFGAASADPGRPCSNPGLVTTVFPAPQNAEAAQRNEPCRRIQQIGLLRVCFWGARAGVATRTVALIGDSHASHWRAAMQTVVDAKGWRAISISRAGCPLTMARPDLPGPTRKAECLRWNREVQRWMAGHPTVGTVFTGAHRGSVLPTPGRSMRATQRIGYAKAWRRILGYGVKQIVVFRDTPRMSGATLPCIQRAVFANQAPGVMCALPRRYALRPDPEAEAAALVRSPRVQVADLSAFFCGPEVCPPVVGGALVLRDVSHMTTTFSSTLGPYLLRTVDRLSASWR
ncbi:MAG: acyltransferase [Solirubrobacterales bacterium]|nr:acyltransferase [Solirubrobacterales bacterium]